MIEKKESTHITYLNGYFKALNDISGGQNEFHITASFILSDESIINEIKFFTHKDVNNINIIKIKTYKEVFGIGYFLRDTLLIKPFSGLYPPWNSHTIPKDNLKLYMDYCIDHISDYIDFTFINDGLDMSDIYSKDIDLLLIERDDSYAITIIIKINNLKILLNFYPKILSKDDFYDLYLHISKKIDKQQEQTKGF